MVDNLEIEGNFRQGIEKWDFPVYYTVSVYIRTLQVYFSPIALLLRLALKSQYFFVVGAEPFPAYQHVKHMCFDRAFQMFHILPVVYKSLPSTSPNHTAAARGLFQMIHVT